MNPVISLLQAQSLSKNIGDTCLFENISLSIHKEEKIGLVARNGAGKTSLLRILAGKDSPDEGVISLRGGTRLGYLEQDPRFSPGQSVLEAVLNTTGDLAQTIQDYEFALEEGNPSRLATAHLAMDHAGAWDAEARIKQILGKLNIHRFNQPAAELSGGQIKRLALARTLFSPADILLLDEPTNHLDLGMVEWLEEFLSGLKCAILMITHDRYFLDRVCTNILELDEQKLFTYQGNYSYFLEKKEERIQQTVSRIEKAQNLYKRELEWIRRMPSARGTKSKSRVEAFSSLESLAQQRINTTPLDFNLKTPRIGKKILDLHDLSKSFGSLKILKNFSYKFKPSEKTGIIGPNGSGKSTLLNLIAGIQKPDSGKIEIGETILMGYFKQEGLSLKEEMTPLELAKELAEIVVLNNGSKISVSQFLQNFLFPPDLQRTPIAKLSGGEKRRLQLILTLMQNPNFLLLDEPTNDLDIQTLQVLEEYLLHFPGCVLIVSHDRFFLDKITDHLFVFNSEGKVDDYPGNFSQYREWKKKNGKREQSPASNSTKPVQKEKSGGTKKPGFKEKFELEQVEKEISLLENEKSNLEEALNSGSLSTEELLNHSKRLADLLETLNEKGNRWIELAELLDQ